MGVLIVYQARFQIFERIVRMIIGDFTSFPFLSLVSGDLDFG